MFAHSNGIDVERSSTPLRSNGEIESNTTKPKRDTNGIKGGNRIKTVAFTNKFEKETQQHQYFKNVSYPGIELGWSVLVLAEGLSGVNIYSLWLKTSFLGFHAA